MPTAKNREIGHKASVRATIKTAAFVFVAMVVLAVFRAAESALPDWLGLVANIGVLGAILWWVWLDEYHDAKAGGDAEK